MIIILKISFQEDYADFHSMILSGFVHDNQIMVDYNSPVIIII